MSKFFLGCRRKTYDIGIRYGGRSKTRVFGNSDIEVLTFDIEEKTSISLYDIGGRSKMRVFGNFDIEVFSTISWSKLRYRYTISTFNIGIYGCRRQNSSMSYTTSNTTSGYTDVEACPFRCRTRYYIAAFPPPAAGRTGHVPAGNLNMTQNLKFSSCPGSHHPLLFFRLYQSSILSACQE